MGPWMLLAPLLFGMTVVVLKSSKPKGEDGIGTEPKGDDHPSIEPDPVKLSNVRQLAIVVGAPPAWQDFFIMTAQGESGGNPNVGLGTKLDTPPWVDMNTSAGEVKAAFRAYDRNKQYYVGCWPRAAYGFGSGGWFGLLPANAIIAFKNDEKLRCLHPWAVFDPHISMIMAAWFARRLQGWSNWDGTVLSMRVGWGAPEKMGDKKHLAKKREKFAEDCEQVGLPASFLDEKLPSWKPAPASELYVKIGSPKGWLPGE